MGYGRSCCILHVASALCIALCAGILFVPAFARQGGDDKLAFQRSLEAQRRLYQRQLLREVLSRAQTEGIARGMLAPELVLSVAWRFGQVHLDTFSWEFRADFQAHSLWPETVYVRSNGNIVGWFEEPFGQDPSIVEIPADKSLPFYLWPDRAVFLSDFLAKEGQFPQQQLLDILVARGVIPPSFGSASSQELKGKEHG